jgi:hypothetical protein
MRKEWSDAEVTFLKEYGGKFTVKELSAILERTENQVYSYTQYHLIRTGGFRWTV